MTLGQAFFNIPGLVAHADSADALIGLARAFPDWSLDGQIRKNFLDYMTTEYCIQGGWLNADVAQLQRVATRMQAQGR